MANGINFLLMATSHVPNPVTLTDTDELEVGYNSVLQEEIQSVYQSVDEISTAFGKLEELRDVVNRLQRDETSTGGHSASLLEVMASTLELQQKLSTKLRETFDVVTQNTKPLQAKRERVGTDVDGRQMKSPDKLKKILERLRQMLDWIRQKRTCRRLSDRKRKRHLPVNVKARLLPAGVKMPLCPLFLDASIAL
ncbi:hypothetical protein PR001_g21932 [Phytophthora rubi]|uniref:Syntaxin N-terminal domain-containing protein n=1 Tax=Phytophthora rubi TaxID=129364 RepID=A0A6A3J3J2_9STRA|nr:hypothetical protein PR001_g21932 [Phytophthora rubi]